MQIEWIVTIAIAAMPVLAMAFYCRKLRAEKRRGSKIGFAVQQFRQAMSYNPELTWDDYDEWRKDFMNPMPHKESIHTGSCPVCRQHRACQ